MAGRVKRGEKAGNGCTAGEVPGAPKEKEAIERSPEAASVSRSAQARTMRQKRPPRVRAPKGGSFRLASAGSSAGGRRAP